MALSYLRRLSERIANEHIRTQQQQPIAETMRILIEALQAVAGGDEATLGLQANLKVESERIEADIAVTRKRIEELLVMIEEQWLDDRECAYELSAVFIHR